MGFVWSQRGQIIFFSYKGSRLNAAKSIIDHYGKFITNENWTKSVCGSTQSPLLTHTKNGMIFVWTPFWLITQPSKLATSNQSALSLSYKFINTHLQILFGFTGDYKEIILRVLYQLVFQIWPHWRLCELHTFSLSGCASIWTDFINEIV